MIKQKILGNNENLTLETAMKVVNCKNLKERKLARFMDHKGSEINFCVTLIAFLLFFTSINSSCNEQQKETKVPTSSEQKEPTEEEKPVLSIITGAEQLDAYLPDLEGKRVGMLVNQTSMIGDDFLVDVLLERGVKVEKIFAPEHGFRGQADAGAHVKDGKDLKTGLPIISLYGKHKKPTKEDLDGLDILIFDIQDVGARFYTYISSMHYVMEACAENKVKFMVLDRPNPNGHYVDGPVLKKSHKSFVGMHPVPVVHGMTVGEYAQMINGEGWLEDGQKVDLKVIPCQNYNHNKTYTLPVRPSPNLPNDRSIYLYPSLCFFEGTIVSIGRGTRKQFQVIGHPEYKKAAFYFTPIPRPGATKPKLQDQLCYGINLSDRPVISELRAQTSSLQIEWLIQFYNTLGKGEAFFNKNLFFDKLAGGTELREQIVAGVSAEDIRKSWETDLAAFGEIREKYLLYR